MADFYTDRRPSPFSDDSDRPLDREGLRDANSRLRASTPAFRQEEMRVKIRTNAVHRHRGKCSFGTVGEYLSFMTGLDDGGI
jgi:hypothetical protein